VEMERSGVEVFLSVVQFLTFVTVHP
jgi:hypothetical protein